jgi:hypothetical protein
MGWNSAIVVLHDQLSSIERDPKRFVECLNNAIMSAAVNQEVHIPGAVLVHTAHADSLGIIAVGGNCGDHLGYVYGVSNRGTDESRIEIVKQLADNLGYRLSRKPKKKSSKG